MRITIDNTYYHSPVGKPVRFNHKLKHPIRFGSIVLFTVGLLAWICLL